MRTVRCLHFADLHLGVEAAGRPNPSSGLNQRIHDVCDRLDEVCATVEAEGVDVVLFAGDAFKHQHPTPTLQRLFAERIRRIARSGAAVFLCVGNHDLPKMAALAHPFSIYSALEVEGVVIGDRAEVYRVPLPERSVTGEMQIAALPHFSRQQVLSKLPDNAEHPDALITRKLEETVQGLAGAIDPSSPAVFVGHCHVNQAEIGATQGLFGVSEIEVLLSTLTAGGAFPYYALGHIHRHQVLARDPYIAYSGSLERVDFGEGEKVRIRDDGAVVRREAEPKGFVRFDLTEDAGTWRLAGEPVFRTVDARGFLTVELGFLGTDPEQALADAVARIRASEVSFEDAFVKITCEIDGADRGRLPHGRVRSLVPEAYDVRLAAVTRDDGTRVRDPRFATRMGEVEALERYLETRDEWAADREELVRLGRGLIEEVTS